MYDKNFKLKTNNIRKDILSKKVDVKIVKQTFEKHRDLNPYIFQLETTNVCNMKCVMCPRTDLMKRKLGSMDVDTFEKIIKQIGNNNLNDNKEWEDFVKNEMMSNSIAKLEDHFYFNICSNTLILHGFGEPILDKSIVEKVKICQKYGLKTYFSMNPINLFYDKIEELMSCGLTYLKISLEGMDNETQLKYRGTIDKTFEITLEKILKIIELKKSKNYQTEIILTKLNFKENDINSDKFIEYWSQFPVMVYTKNQHNRWLFEEENSGINTAEYMNRYCDFPWTSMSILYNGDVVPCPLDYDSHLKMGNIFESSLYEIWNSSTYNKFREMHLNGDFPENHFCLKNCDINPVFNYLL